MSVDRDTVRKIAHLARLKIDEAQEKALVGELNGILAWVEQLKEIDTAGVEPMTSVVKTQLKLRADQVNDGGNLDAVLKNAPDAKAGFYAVPKVVE